MQDQTPALDGTIFRAYDIRGIVDETLTETGVYWVGRAFASILATNITAGKVVVGGDGRTSTPRLRKALCNGLQDSGANVLDVGMVPTPVVYFAEKFLEADAAIVVTGSHNPVQYNGLKFTLRGEPFAGDKLQKLLAIIRSNSIVASKGSTVSVDILDQYGQAVLEVIDICRTMRVVIDTGNGVAGVLSRSLFEGLGCEVIHLYEDVDGTFPNHEADPMRPANMRDLVRAVVEEKADVGLGFDGDGDRLGVVVSGGRLISSDLVMSLFVRDVLKDPAMSRSIVHDVKCGRTLLHTIEKYGGHPILSATGHTNMKSRLKSEQASFAGEFSGHFCFADRWYPFDDALYAGARLIEILAQTQESSDSVFKQFPVFPSTSELFVKVEESRKFAIIEQLKSKSHFAGISKVTIDGVRINYSDGWGLVRASNTGPLLTLRFEADTESRLAEIFDEIQQELFKIDSSLRIPSANHD